MLPKLKRFIAKNKLLIDEDRLLLAVSGGKDSVCLLHLFTQLDYPLAVAHCNFLLRGEESNKDEQFVRSLSEHYELPFFCKRFDTKTYSKEKSISTQMAARELRYNWFADLGFDKIATAHHQDDNIETLLLKKNRKASLEGLCGIPLINKNIIRPFLVFSSKEIKEYLLENNHFWREDASNESTDYQRNEIRLKQLPKMEKQDSNVRTKLLQELTDNQKRYDLLLKEVDKIRPLVWRKQNNHVEFLFKTLLNHPQKEELMYELLKEYGAFPWKDVFALTKAISGKEIRNEKYRLLKDRESILVIEQHKKIEQTVFIDNDLKSIYAPITLSFSIVQGKQEIDLSNSSIAALDFEKLSFPLTLRKWQKGDFFIPLGMQGRKKVSDYMIDQKFTILQKENTWVLCSNNEIVWLVGHRLDDRFKLVAQTEKVYLVQPY